MKEDAIIKALDHMIPFEEVSTLGGAMLASDEAEKEAVDEFVPKEADDTVDNQVVELN